MKEILEKKPKKTLNIWVELSTTHHLIKSVIYFYVSISKKAVNY